MCLLAMMITSCENNITSDNLTVNEDGTVPVNISLSMLSGINYDTGYEPMSRADNLPKAQIGRTYAVLISKKYENRWILDKFLKNNFNGYSIKIYNDEVFHNFSTDLRPGEYKMTIITGVSSLNFDEDLQPGLVVEDENGNILPACTYRIEETGYLNPEAESLQEEIFSGCVPFTVEKTEDLHSGSLINNVHIQLTRKVTKLRIFLKEEYNGNKFAIEGYDPGISAQLDITDENIKFCNGLNIWGDIYYDDNKPLTSMKYGAFASKKAEMSSADNHGYYAPISLGARQFCIFYFSDPNQVYPVEVSKISITYYSGGPEHAYAYPEYGTPSTDTPVNLTMKHNTQHGIAFAPGITELGDRMFDMILLTDKDYTDLFPLSFEYR